MNAVATVAIALFSSGLTSTIVAAVLKGRFDAKMARLSAEIARDNRLLEERIESSAAYRAAQISTAQEVATTTSREAALAQFRESERLHEARRRIYPDLESSSYRLLRMLKDDLDGRGERDAPSPTQRELLAKVENLLFDLRLDLEADGVFFPLHRFKNTLRAAIDVSDAAGRSAKGDDRARLRSELETLVADLSAQHAEIVPTLSELVRRLPPPADRFRLHHELSFGPIAELQTRMELGTGDAAAP